MRMMRIPTVVLLLLGAAFSSAAAQEQSALSKTDIGLSLYGALSKKTSNTGETVSPSNSAGAMFELRYLSNPILGLEGTYSYNHADQTYTATPGGCPVGFTACSTTEEIKAAAKQVTVNWVPSLHFANMRIFGELGLGLQRNVPDSGQTNTQTSTRLVYDYGAGLDFSLLPHIGVRGQYRGNLYKPPQLTNQFPSMDKFTQTAEPMLGVYLRL